MTKPNATSDLRRDLRRRIVDAAWKLGNESGDEALTIRNIAAQVGISPALLYTYFDGKGALIRHMQAMVAPQLDDMLGEAIASASSPSEGLFRLCTAYVAFAREHRWLYDASPREHEGEGANRPAADAFVSRATALLEAMPRDESAATVALRLRVALGGLAAAAPRVIAQPDEIHAFADGYIRMLLRGVTPVSG